MLLLLIIFLLIMPVVPAQGYDTVKLSLKDAEHIFLETNAQLLAAKYAIAAGKAAEIQAGLWSNPTLSIGQNVYNKETQRAFDFTKAGNTDLSVQQLFLLAGKRDKQIKLAELNTKMSEQNYFNLLRALKYELRGDYCDLYYLQKQLAFYDENIPHVRETLTSLEKLYKDRSLLLSELLRIKSLLLTLESSRQDVLTRIGQIQGDLKILLNDTAKSVRYYVPEAEPCTGEKAAADNFSLPGLIDLALSHRPDIKIADLAVTYEKNNLSYQRSLAIPDVYLGANYSRSGSYISDYFGISMQIDLPFFNRNQGNIEVSQNTLASNVVTLYNAKLTLQRDVEVSYKKVREASRVYRGLDSLFRQQYASLVYGTVANYQKRNITVIEFTDFWESYRNVAMQEIQIENNLADALEELGYIVGTDIGRE